MKIPYEKKLEIVKNDVEVGRSAMLEELYEYLNANNEDTSLVVSALKIAFNDKYYYKYEALTFKIIDKYELKEAYDVLWC